MSKITKLMAKASLGMAPLILAAQPVLAADPIDLTPQGTWAGLGTITFAQIVQVAVTFALVIALATKPASHLAFT